MAIRPDGSTAALVSMASVSSPGGLTLVSVATSRTIGSIPLQGGPLAVVFAPSGSS